MYFFKYILKNYQTEYKYDIINAYQIKGREHGYLALGWLDYRYTYH